MEKYDQTKNHGGCLWRPLWFFFWRGFSRLGGLIFKLDGAAVPAALPPPHRCSSPLPLNAVTAIKHPHPPPPSNAIFVIHHWPSNTAACRQPLPPPLPPSRAIFAPVASLPPCHGPLLHSSGLKNWVAGGEGLLFYGKLSVGLFDGLISGRFPWFLVCLRRYRIVPWSTRLYDTCIGVMLFMGLKIAESG